MFISYKIKEINTIFAPHFLNEYYGEVAQMVRAQDS